LPSATRIVGRVSCETVKDPVANTAIIKANQLIDEEIAAALDKVGHRAAQDPLRPHLREQARRLRQVLRPQPLHRPA